MSLESSLYKRNRSELFCKIKNIFIIYLLGFPAGSAGKESACNAEDLGSIPGLGRSPGEGNSYPLQCSGLENSMDCIVQGVAKSQTQLSDFHFTHFILIHSCARITMTML